jgi:uncharacterized membrane protein
MLSSWFERGRSAVSDDDGADPGYAHDLDDPVWTDRIHIGDVRDALRLGWRDFAAAPVPGLLLAAPVTAIGLVLVAAALRHALVPLIVPLVAGFALVGPFAAIGHYRLSRRRELGLATSWWRTPALLFGPRSGAVFGLGLVLAALTFAWIATAALLTRLMLPQLAEAGAMAVVLLATPEGHRLMAVGAVVGAAFAFPVFAVAVVAFPMLVDRDVDIVSAALTSCAAVAQNPLPMGLWALVVLAGLILGAVPAMAGLLVVLPVLGHATWHLYRRLVIP